VFSICFPLTFLLFLCACLAWVKEMERSGVQNKKPWYSNGLRFECQRCGNCCRGEPGYIWVNVKEADAISRHMQESPSKFAEKYLRKVGHRISLLERPNGDCILYSNGCSIYEVRPKQCRTFPFWRSNLKSKGTWEALKGFCQGVDRGRLHTQDKIDRILKDNLP